MAFWIRTAVLYLAIASGVVWMFGFDQPTGLNLLFLLAGFIPSVVNHSPRLYLLFKRGHYWLLNANTTWDLTLAFKGEFARENIVTLVDRLATEGRGETRVLEATDARFLLHYHRLFIVELVLGPDFAPLGIGAERQMVFTTLNVAVFDQQIAYRRSKRVLERILVPFVEQLKDALSPKSGCYALRVRFDGVNPFLGLYLKQLRAEAVRDFQFEFSLPESESSEYVRVERHEMVVNARSLEGLRRSVLVGLTFGAAVN